MSTLPPAIYDETIPHEICEIIKSLWQNHTRIKNLIEKSEPDKSRLEAALFHLTECLNMFRQI